MVELTRKEYNIILKNRGIIESQKMFTLELLNILDRYDSSYDSRRKVKNEKKSTRKNC